MPIAKNPPPDSVANVRGRILLVKERAHQAARMDQRDGEDWGRALQRRLKFVSPKLEALRKRLVQAQKEVTPVKPKEASKATSVKPKGKPSPKTKRTKKKTPKSSHKESESFLDALNALCK